jgi:AraC family transcriptional regulator
MDLSPCHVHRMFTRAVGMTPIRMITELRIAEAQRLLVTTTLTVAEVGAALGYHNLGHFIWRFTALTGKTPLRFREGPLAEPASPLAREVRAARKAKGLTQGQLAERAGVAEMTVRNIERGYHEPKAATIARINAALDKA